MYKGILSLIGRTPLVRLDKVSAFPHLNLYAKLEALNPGGSIKDRTAFNILREAIELGDLRVGDTVVESSSGNMGIGLAQACAYIGLNFICVVDPKTTAQNISIIKAYGARIEMVEEVDLETGEYLPVRIRRVRELLSELPRSFWPDQYSNLHNPGAHHATMREINAELGGRVDYLFVATSTCGTLRGCSDYIRQSGMKTTVIAVDAVGSVIFGGRKSKRLIPGHGAAVRPKLFKLGMASECVHITYVECIAACRRLVSEEAILAGGSSGAVLAAFQRVGHRLPAGSNCVLIFPDRGERYLDTIYSESWVHRHFGAIESGAQADAEEATCVMSA